MQLNLHMMHILPSLLRTLQSTPLSSHTRTSLSPSLSLPHNRHSFPSRLQGRHSPSTSNTAQVMGWLICSVLPHHSNKESPTECSSLHRNLPFFSPRHLHTRNVGPVCLGAAESARSRQPSRGQNFSRYARCRSAPRMDSAIRRCRSKRTS